MTLLYSDLLCRSLKNFAAGIRDDVNAAKPEWYVYSLNVGQYLLCLCPACFRFR